MRQICLDTETTGRDPENGDRLVEIGCVELDGRRLTLDDRFLYHTLINPEREVPEEVVAIHNLTTERLAGEPKFAEIVDKFLDFVRGAELIIHNAEFDVGFLNMELARIGRPPLRASAESRIRSRLRERSIRGREQTSTRSVPAMELIIRPVRCMAHCLTHGCSRRSTSHSPGVRGISSWKPPAVNRLKS